MKMENQTSWFSNGNLIISGEYFVLSGAKALAVPLKFGQEMKVDSFNNNSNTIQWKTKVLGKPWFEAAFSCKDLSIKNSSDKATASYLQELLTTIRKIQPGFISKKESHLIKCEIDFNLSWGWGSSATLISNLANYAGVDPFVLNRMVSSGSGYDIAASLARGPVFYQLNEENNETTPVAFNPPFKEFIWFLYLGRKQSTSSSIEKNLKSVKKNKNLIPLITDLTGKMASEENLKEFIRIITEHEKVISKALKMEKIRDRYFSDLDGEIKSLGAWGGDCVMVVSSLNETVIKQYFRKKGFDTIFRFDEIIKSNYNYGEVRKNIVA